MWRMQWWSDAGQNWVTWLHVNMWALNSSLQVTPHHRAARMMAYTPVWLVKTLFRRQLPRWPAHHRVRMDGRHSQRVTPLPIFLALCSGAAGQQIGWRLSAVICIAENSQDVLYLACIRSKRNIWKQREVLRKWMKFSNDLLKIMFLCCFSLAVRCYDVRTITTWTKDLNNKIYILA